MVVVAILALISVVAVPVLSSYTTKAKFSDAAAILNELDAADKVYYGRNSSFGNLAQLGYPHGSGLTATDIPDDFSGYYSKPYIIGIGSDPDNYSNYTCPVVTHFVYVSNINSTGAFSNNNPNSDYIVYYHTMYAKDSIINTICTYSYVGYVNGVQELMQGDFIPGCHNQQASDISDLMAPINSC